MNKQILINYEEYLKLVDDSNYNNERFDKSFHDYVKNINELQERIDKAIEYIEEYCIDDEFYVNLTKKEKSIIEVLHILRGEDND